MWEKYKEICDVIKNKVGIKFHSEPIYEQKYLKAKVENFAYVRFVLFVRVGSFRKKV